jgi:hypothetical protein
MASRANKILWYAHGGCARALRSMAAHASSCLRSSSRLSLKQPLDLFSNMVRAAGLTKDAMGITPHGLRHEFAGDLYFDIAEVMPPVRGGVCVVSRIIGAVYAKAHRALRTFGTCRAWVTGS